MKHYLVTFNNNYKDEFDIWGSQIVDDKDFDSWNAALKMADLNNELVEWYFGSNEGFDGEPFHLWAKHYKFKEITDEERQHLIDSFPEIEKTGIGHFPDLLDILEQVLDIDIE